MFPQKEDPLFILLEGMVTGNPSDAIVNSEKRGQQMFIASEVLPKDLRYCTREQLESLGIVFGEDADDLFVYVTLPEGWHKVATGHDMWSHLVDNQGYERADIFYKAAFYDRSAHLSLARRYSYTVEPVCGWGEDYSKSEWLAVVKDAGTVIWKSEPIEPEPEYNGNRGIGDRTQWMAWMNKKDNLSEVAKEWLDNNCPDWQNPLAYW